MTRFRTAVLGALAFYAALLLYAALLHMRVSALEAHIQTLYRQQSVLARGIGSNSNAIENNSHSIELLAKAGR